MLIAFAMLAIVIFIIIRPKDPNEMPYNHEEHQTLIKSAKSNLNWLENHAIPAKERGGWLINIILFIAYGAAAIGLLYVIMFVK